MRVPLNAGILKVAAKSQKTGEVLAESIFTVWRTEETKDNETASVRRDPIWVGRGGDSELILPAGAYVVRLDNGLAHPEQTATLTAGARATAEFSISLGRLELLASLTDAGPPATEASYIISEDDPDSPQGRREIARSAHPEPSFSLPAGTYYVTARLGANEVRQRIALGAGDVVKRTLVVGLIRLDVAPVMEQGPLPPQAAVLHRVLRNDGDLREIARSTDTAANFLLPAGRYRIETTLGSENVKAVTDIDVQPARDAKIAMKLQAGRVTIKPSEATAPGAAPPSWEVRDARGIVVWRGGQEGNKAGLLAPGRYVLRSQVAERRLEKAFELKSGEARTVDLGSP